VYGLDDGILACLELATGRMKWKGGRYGHGQVLLVDDVLLVMTETGDVVLVQADPSGHHELARSAILHGKTWNNPALAGKYLVVRNAQEAACFELPIDGPYSF
jgi:outer membrane protein assembly factor BamB